MKLPNQSPPVMRSVTPAAMLKSVGNSQDAVRRGLQRHRLLIASAFASERLAQAHGGSARSRHAYRAQNRGGLRMVCAIRTIVIAALCLAAGAAAAQTAARDHEDKACKAKVEKCISQCVMHNPKNVCTRYCRPGLVCG
jgi:hypothetical protein